MRLIHRPLGPWPQPASRTERAQFTASWSDTLELLEREVCAVRWRNQQDEPVVLQLDVPESAVRLDGGVRSNARAGYHGVIISFDSKHGPLRYLCDRFDKTSWKTGGSQQPWQANVRAIALGLEALRSVDRYGISNDGEQYRGWNALPPATEAAAAPMTVDEAARTLLRLAGLPSAGDNVARVRADLQAIYRQAAKRTHPDLGGDPADFRLVTEALEVLGGAS